MLNTGLNLALIALIAVTSTGILGILVNIKTDYYQFVRVVPAVASVAALFLKLYLMEFKPHDEAVKHRNAANDLWEIRQEYMSVITEFKSLDDSEIQQERHKLCEKVAVVNKHYPAPDPKSYEAARKSIKEKIYTFDEGEFEDLLPKGID